MRIKDKTWMAYIDAEVRAVCEAKGWRHQIRRRWSVRQKMVSWSTIDDYEWKIIPDSDGKLPPAAADDYEGVYYVLGFDKSDRKFFFMHDTSHCGTGFQRELTTYTEIRPIEQGMAWPRYKHNKPSEQPPVCWLRDHLLNLITRVKPNCFSHT